MMGDKYLYTLRETIKSEPRVTQTKILVSSFEYKLHSALSLLYSVEKDKDKKASKEKLQFYKSEMKGVELHELITESGKYWQFLNKWVKTSEGWNNLRKI